ncbi:Nuclear transport factor 2 [Orbilia oligospora]|uniref:Nuclear transport factor 2 n=1 Tax=Orbilia oligospora TaxID=2813651 RepID=A0A6G1M616_ORBOL|nr:Nuclear transport factor 2 [Orbilia oligospora]KAF3223971.1 Nuclear transport factor 2 [Orbilia oligospora]KAF3246618.1 Nuclear transport factor 2 [Orbilia oligospora]
MATQQHSNTTTQQQASSPTFAHPILTPPNVLPLQLKSSSLSSLYLQILLASRPNFSRPQSLSAQNTPDYAGIADQFITYYYNTFDSNRQGLSGLYRPTSLLTFESSQTQGATDIADKLLSLPFQKVAHEVTTKDAQPLPGGSGIVVLVTGALKVDDSPAPLSFAQTFILLPEGGSYFVAHDIFKLVYPA